MANVDLSAEQITEIPTQAVGQKTTVQYVREQLVSWIQLFFDFRDSEDVYLGSSDILIADSTAGITIEQWAAAKVLVEDPTKTPEDLVNILANQEWGKALLAMKWRTRDYVQVPGKDD